MKNSLTKTVKNNVIRLHKPTSVIFKLDGNGIWQQIDSKELFKII